MFVNFSMYRIVLILLFVSSLFAKDIIAVLELEQKGLTKQEAEILTDRLTTKLISIGKYQVVERNNMDKILKVACPPKVVPSVKLVFVKNERNRAYDTQTVHS